MDMDSIELDYDLIDPMKPLVPLYETQSEESVSDQNMSTEVESLASCSPKQDKCDAKLEEEMLSETWDAVNEKYELILENKELESVSENLLSQTILSSSSITQDYEMFTNDSYSVGSENIGKNVYPSVPENIKQNAHSLQPIGITEGVDFLFNIIQSKEAKNIEENVDSYEQRKINEHVKTLHNPIQSNEVYVNFHQENGITENVEVLYNIFNSRETENEYSPEQCGITENVESLYNFFNSRETENKYFSEQCGITENVEILYNFINPNKVKNNEQNIQSSVKFCLEQDETVEEMEISYENKTPDSLNSEDLSVSSSEESETFTVFWLDICEDESSQQGIIVFFGKTFSKQENNYNSCAVVVKNVTQKCYLYPQKSVQEEEKQNFHDIKEEFSREFNVDIHNITTSTKLNAFYKNIPGHENEFVEVEYTNKMVLNPNVKFKSFSHVLQTNISNVQSFMLEQKLKGPCWLEIKNFQTSKEPTYSQMEVEIIVEDPTNITKSNNLLPIPDLNILALNILTYKDSIVLLSAINAMYNIQENSYTEIPKNALTLLTKPEDQTFPKLINEAYFKTPIVKLENDAELLADFVKYLGQLDPDFIIGYDLFGKSSNILTSHLQKINSNRLSRLKFNFKCPFPAIRKNIFTGRLVCDLDTASKVLGDFRSTDLKMLSDLILKDKSVETVDPKNMFNSLLNIVKDVNIHVKNTSSVLKLMVKLNVIPIFLQITNITGNLMSKTLLDNVADCVESLLLDTFHSNNYILPDKNYSIKNDFEDNLVLNPITGFYNQFVLQFNFETFYLNIIQEYDMCLTDDNPKILPKLISELKDLKTTMKYKNDEIQETALKLISNLIFECITNSNYRFNNIELANNITENGREIIQDTINTIENLGYDVIYGDTDCVMVKMNMETYEVATEIALIILEKINIKYSYIKLQLEGIFNKFLLLEKEKYAALEIKSNNGILTKSITCKNITQRDSPKLFNGVEEFLLQKMFESPETCLNDIFEHLQNIVYTIDKHPLEDFLIKTRLSNDPNLFSEENQLPHIILAKRINEIQKGHFKSGDIVSYIFCKNNLNRNSFTEVFLLEEVRNRNDLKIDYYYYLKYYLFNLVETLCIPGNFIDENIEDLLRL